MALRRRFFDSLSTRSTSIMSGHLRRSSARVEKNQLLDFELPDLRQPGLAALLRLLSVLLLGVKRFF